jgi:hypothetical protein
LNEEVKRQKIQLTQMVDDLEVISKIRDPTEKETKNWQRAHQYLAEIYHSKEVYWSIRARDQ